MSAAISASSTSRATDTPALRVGGLVPLSTTDWPGRLAATVFCQGCPWACGYCHNPHLIPARGGDGHDWATMLGFLELRRGLLDAVVFSGGEPLYQRGLESAVAAVRDMGFEVGLHTGGAYPERLRRLLPSLDWVGLDVKASFDDYDRVTGVPASGKRARLSLAHLLASNVDHEIRTTVHPLVFSRDSLLRLAEELAAMKVDRYVLQAFRPVGCNDASYLDESAGQLLEADLCRRIGARFRCFEVRTGD